MSLCFFSTVLTYFVPLPPIIEVESGCQKCIVVGFTCTDSFSLPLIEDCCIQSPSDDSYKFHERSSLHVYKPEEKCTWRWL